MTATLKALTLEGAHSVMQKYYRQHAPYMSIEKSSENDFRIPVRQLKAARALLAWSQADLAQHSGVSEPTIARLESEDGLLGGKTDTAEKILNAISRAGVTLIVNTNGSFGVQLSKKAAKSYLGNDYSTMGNAKSIKSDQRHDFGSVQCKMARIALGWGTRDLAEAASVSPDTIARLERGEQLKSSTLHAVRTTFEAAGIEFIPEDGGGPGVRAPKPKG
jgi:transcriptional regulator with XRE-family HTH domain